MTAKQSTGGEPGEQSDPQHTAGRKSARQIDAGALSSEKGSTPQCIHGKWAYERCAWCEADAAEAKGTGFKASPTSNLESLRTAIATLPTRKELLGGQWTTYVQLDNVLALIEQAQRPAPETTDNDICAVCGATRKEHEGHSLTPFVPRAAEKANELPCVCVDFAHPACPVHR